MAIEIGVSKSTVSREIRRNSKPCGEYVWKYAQAQCDSRRRGLKGDHRKPAELWWRVDRMIEEDWPPGQIPGDCARRVSIYAAGRPFTTMLCRRKREAATHMPYEIKHMCRMRKQPVTKASTIKDRTSMHDCPRKPTAGGLVAGRWTPSWIPMGMRYSPLPERSMNFMLMERLPRQWMRVCGTP